MRTKLTRQELQQAGWKNFSADWYWYYPGDETTHIHLRGSANGDTVDIKTISIKVEDRGIGTIWNGSHTNWGLLDDIDPAIATFFRKGFNAADLH